MELEDIAKRLDWLEKEQRKDHTLIGDLQQQIDAYEGNFGLLRDQIKEVTTDLTRFTSLAGRLDQFDSMIAQYRAEISKTIEDLEKRREKHEREIETRRRTELDNINKSYLELRKSLDVLPEFKKGLKAREDDSGRLTRLISELDKRIGDFSGSRTRGDQYRYVDSSIWSLLREFAKAGISAKSLECKVFGGASPLHQNCDASAGNRNVKVAMEVLAEEGVTVSASSVGGNGGRKLFFRTDTGLVLQKRFIVTTCKECKTP